MIYQIFVHWSVTSMWSHDITKAIESAARGSYNDTGLHAKLEGDDWFYYMHMETIVFWQNQIYLKKFVIVYTRTGDTAFWTAANVFVIVATI